MHQQGKDFAFWNSKPYAERIGALEEIRRDYQAWEQAAKGEAGKKASRRLQDLADLEIWNN